MKFRIKGIFPAGNGKEFARYWRNSRGVTGWLFPDLVGMADTFTAKQCATFTANLRAKRAGRYSFEPVR